MGSEERGNDQLAGQYGGQIDQHRLPVPSSTDLATLRENPVSLDVGLEYPQDTIRSARYV